MTSEDDKTRDNPPLLLELEQWIISQTWLSGISSQIFHWPGRSIFRYELLACAHWPLYHYHPLTIHTTIMALYISWYYGIISDYIWFNDMPSQVKLQQYQLVMAARPIVSMSVSSLSCSGFQFKRNQMISLWLPENITADVMKQKPS